MDTDPFDEPVARYVTPGVNEIFERQEIISIGDYMESFGVLPDAHVAAWLVESGAPPDTAASSMRRLRDFIDTNTLDTP